MTPFEMLIPAGNAGSVSHETGGGVLRVMLAGSKAHNSFPDLRQVGLEIDGVPE